jgi:hypothetical protein
MSDADGSCEYVATHDDWLSWEGQAEEWDEWDELLDEMGVEGDVWPCPHPTADGHERCVFHRPPGTVATERVVAAFLDAVDDAGPDDRTNQFVGVTLAALPLGDAHLEPPESGVRLVGGEVEGSVAADGVVDGRLGVAQLSVGGDVEFDHADLRGDVDVRGAEVDGDLLLRHADAGGDVDLVDVLVGGTVSLWGADVRGRVNLEWSRVGDLVDLRRADVGDYVYAWGVECDADVRLSSLTVEGHCDFEAAEIEGDLTYRDGRSRDALRITYANVGGELDLRETHAGGLDLEETAVGGDLSLGMARVRGDGVFQCREVGGAIDCSGLRVTRNAVFREMDLAGADLSRAELPNARLDRADLRCADLEGADLGRATLYGTDLRGGKLAGVLLGDARADEATRLLGGPWVTSPVVAELATPCCAYDPSLDQPSGLRDRVARRLTGGVTTDGDDALTLPAPDVGQAKAVYRTLEELAGRSAQPRLQGQCFVRRQDLQRRQYWRAVRTSDGVVLPALSALRSVRAEVARWVLLYGESPWRVVLWGTIAVLGFALTYPLGGWMRPVGPGGEAGVPLTYAGPGSVPRVVSESLYYSMLTFTTLGFGDFRPVGLVGRALTTAETALGAILIALLVFVFGRRAAR